MRGILTRSVGGLAITILMFLSLPANASALYVGKDDSSVVGVYDALAGGSFLRSFDIGYTGVDALAFGPDGYLHLGKTDENLIRVYDPVTDLLETIRTKDRTGNASRYRINAI